MRDDSAEILRQSFLQEALLSKSGMGRDVHDVVHPAYPLPTTASSTLYSALRDGFREVVVARDMPDPCEYPSLDSCQKRLLWTQKKIDPFVGLVLQEWC